MACSSIVQSRKRKLRELYSIATGDDAFPSLDFSNLDAPPTAAAEQKFLHECDILQYVAQNFNIIFISFLRRVCIAWNDLADSYLQWTPVRQVHPPSIPIGSFRGAATRCCTACKVGKG
jgi:hypothetical protein